LGRSCFCSWDGPRLRDLSISCSSSAPICIWNAERAVIVLADGSDNYVADGTSYALNAGGDEPNDAIFSKADLTIFGNGSLHVDANYNEGIASKDGLIIMSGTISVSAVDDGTRGKDYLVIKGAPSPSTPPAMVSSPTTTRMPRGDTSQSGDAFL